jgi:hypothetical protein
MNVVVPCLIYEEHKRPTEIAPDTTDDMLEMIASRHMEQPTKAMTKTIRSGDELGHSVDPQIAHEI